MGILSNKSVKHSPSYFVVYENARCRQSPFRIDKSAEKTYCRRVSRKWHRDKQPVALAAEVRAGPLCEAHQVHYRLQQEERRDHGQEDVGESSTASQTSEEPHQHRADQEQDQGGD